MANAIPVSSIKLGPPSSKEAPKDDNARKVGLSETLVSAIESLGGPDTDEGVKLIGEFKALRERDSEDARALRVTKSSTHDAVQRDF